MLSKYVFLYPASYLQLYGVTRDPVSIVMEYVERGALSSVLRSMVEMESEVTDKIIAGIAKGMLHLVEISGNFHSSVM